MAPGGRGVPSDDLIYEAYQIHFYRVRFQLFKWRRSFRRLSHVQEVGKGTCQTAEVRSAVLRRSGGYFAHCVTYRCIVRLHKSIEVWGWKPTVQRFRFKREHKSYICTTQHDTAACREQIALSARGGGLRLAHTPIDLGISTHKQPPPLPPPSRAPTRPDLEHPLTETSNCCGWAKLINKEEEDLVVCTDRRMIRAYFAGVSRCTQRNASYLIPPIEKVAFDDPVVLHERFLLRYRKRSVCVQVSIFSTNNMCVSSVSRHDISRNHAHGGVYIIVIL